MRMPNRSGGKASGMKTKTIKVEYLARVEGEGGLYIKVRDNRVIDVKLKIFEPPRFFEAFLRGRSFSEVPDITARICGICPIAYQMSAVHAPDFLGYQDAIQMAKDHARVVERGLQLKKAGNEIVTLLGGREIHPINVRV